MDAKKKKDPFKTRKTRSEVVNQADTISPPENVAKAIDAFREAQEQAKHFDGEATVYKDQVLEYAIDEYARRTRGGQNGSYKILGEEAMVTFVAQDSSAGLTDEDLEQISSRWGDKAAELLVERDFRSIRFDPKVLAVHYDEVVEALQTLPPDVLDRLFKPMLMKAKSQAVETAKNIAKSEDELKDLLAALKIKMYIR